MNKFDYFIDNKVIYYDITLGTYELASLADFCEIFAEETTTPNGVAPKLHIRNETEIWTWGSRGNNPELVESFYNEDETKYALYTMYLNQIEGVEYILLKNDGDLDLEEFLEIVNSKFKRIEECIHEFKTDQHKKITALNDLASNSNSNSEKRRLEMKSANYRSCLHDFNNRFNLDELF